MILLAASLLCAQSLQAQVAGPDGFRYDLTPGNDKGARRVEIRFCAENIVHVTSSPTDTGIVRPSLVVLKSDWPAVASTVRDLDSLQEVATSRLRVRVDRRTGSVAFYDSDGKIILNEPAGGGKTFTPVEVLGEKTFRVRQIFDSPPDEAFYGLGAHQNGIMNYKGHDVDLTQHNIVDVVPFLVSSRNYGILWDNCSRTRFGDNRDFQPLSGLELFSASGKKEGLTVEYFKDSTFGSLLTSTTERTIEHDFVDAMGTYPPGFDVAKGSIRWKGEIASGEKGTHKLRLYSSGYARLWIDGTLVVDSWRQNWLPWTHLVPVDMEPGKRHAVTLEWTPAGGNIGMKFLPPGDPVLQTSLSLTSEVADRIDYYFIHGKDLDEVIRGYRLVTGKVPMMPKWSLGYWQSRERYRSQEEILGIVKEFRRRHFPIDNVVLDWFYWKEDQWGSHEFDAERFPDPGGMVRTLHDDLHARIMITVWPKFYVGTKHYDEFKSAGWLYMHNIKKGVRDWVGPGYVSTFYDPYGEDARALYWAQIERTLFRKGFDAWWLDSTEPDLQSNVTDSERLLRMHPTALGSAARYENAYSLMNSRGVYENQRKADPDRRVFILTRSAFAGQQRYASATWSGDVATRWEDLRAQIPAGLNFSLSGIPYWTSDIGGFAVEPRFERPGAADLEEWRELNTRWFQFGAFCPLFRSHGQFPFREPFNIAPDDHEAYRSMLYYAKLRYRLMPYLYSLAGMVTQDDYTIMRGLPMDFGGDRLVAGIGDQFMLGPALLVNPVTEYKARSRSVYLPAGAGWYDLATGEKHDGGRTFTADAPYARIPLFVKAGSILPCGPEIENTDKAPVDPVRLFVYTGGDGAFALYEDDGVTYGYERGAFSRIPLRYEESKKKLTIGARQGTFPGMAATRTFEIVWIGGAQPRGLDFASKPDAVVTYTGQELTVPAR